MKRVWINASGKPLRLESDFSPLLTDDDAWPTLHLSGFYDSYLGTEWARRHVSRDFVREYGSLLWLPRDYSFYDAICPRFVRGSLAWLHYESGWARAIDEGSLAPIGSYQDAEESRESRKWSDIIVS